MIQKSSLPENPESVSRALTADRRSQFKRLSLRRSPSHLARLCRWPSLSCRRPGPPPGPSPLPASSDLAFSERSALALAAPAYGNPLFGSCFGEQSPWPQLRPLVPSSVEPSSSRSSLFFNRFCTRYLHRCRMGFSAMYSSGTQSHMPRTSGLGESHCVRGPDLERASHFLIDPGEAKYRIPCTWSDISSAFGSAHPFGWGYWRQPANAER